MVETLRFGVIGTGDASDLDRLAAAVNRITDQIQDLDRQRANPEIDVDTARAQKQVGKFAKDMQRTITRAIESLPEIELDADASEAQREVQAVRAALVELNDKRVGIDIGAEEAQRQVAELQARLAALGDVDIDVQLRADTAAAAAALAEVNGQVDRLDGRTAKVKVDVDRGLADTVIQIAALGRALGTLAIPAALAVAAPQIAGLGAAAVETAGALWLIPAAGAAGAAAFATVKVGLGGVKEALKVRDDAKAFAEALKELSPAAAAFATKVRDLGPAWKEVKLDVQEKLFSGLGDTLGKLSSAYLPSVQSALGGIATAFSTAANESAGFLANDETVKQLAPAFENVKTAVSNAAGALKPLTSAFVTLIDEGSSRLPELGQKLTDVSAKFDDWLKKAQQSGQLGQWIDNGIAAIAQLGRIAGDVGGILGGIFSAADAAGVSFLDTVERITSGIRDFLNSTQGQTTLTNLFTTIRETIDLVLPGLKELALAVVDVVNQLSNAGVFQAAGAAISSIASAVAPVVTQLGNLASAVLPPLLALLGQLAPVLVPIAAALLGLMIATKVGGAIQGLATRVGDFNTKLRGVEGGAGKFKTVIGGLASAVGAGGPLGLAISAAIVGVGLLAQAWADSKADAQAQKDEIDALAESLDKYSGAATEASLATAANDVATKTLADGTTTYATALGNAGVSTKDFVQATQGNAPALEKVRKQLDANVQALIQSDPLYANNIGRMNEFGISLEDLAAAAQGNGPALAKIDSAVARLGGSGSDAGIEFQGMARKLMEAGGTSAEMGQKLNELAGKFELSSQKARDLGLASLSFSENLDSIKPGLDGLAAGGKITQELSDRFVALGESAGVAATAAGDASSALTGVEGGAAAAGKSMEESRAKFIEAATSAGVSATEAENLADKMGLIPSAAEIIFRTNATGVAAEMITLNERIKRLPPNTSITVTDLSAEAKANLEALGFTVTAIPGTKDVKVTAPTDQAKAQLDQFVAFANGASIMMTGDMNVDPATQKVQQTVTLGNGQVAVMTYDANASAADGKIHATVDLGNGQTASLTYDAVPDPATGQIKAVVDYGNGQTAELTLDPNDQVTPTLDQLLHPETIPVDITTGTNTAQTDKDAVVNGPGEAKVDITTGTNTAQTDKDSVVNAPGSAHVDINTGTNTAQTDKEKVEQTGETKVDINPGADNVTPKLGTITQPTSSTHTINVTNNVPAATTANSAATTSTHTINVTNNVPAAAAANAAGTSSTHTINVTNNVPGAKSANAGATSSTHTINVTNNVPAAKTANGGATSSLHTINVTDLVPAAKTAASLPSSSLHTLNVDEKPVLDAKGRAEQPTSSMHTINCDKSAVDAAKRSAEGATSSTHTINVQINGSIPANTGGGVYGYSGGGVRGIAPVHAAGGMVVKGYAPGKDTIPAVISKGEAVLVPELVRMLGARRILAANAAASGGREATVIGQLAGMMDGSIGRYAGGGVAAPRMAGGGYSRPMPRWSTSGGGGTDALAREIHALSAELRARDGGKDVNIVNTFAIANASQTADEVSRAQRVAGAMGIFGG